MQSIEELRSNVLHFFNTAFDIVWNSHNALGVYGDIRKGLIPKKFETNYEITCAIALTKLRQDPTEKRVVGYWLEELVFDMDREQLLPMSVLDDQCTAVLMTLIRQMFPSMSDEDILKMIQMIKITTPELIFMFICHIYGDSLLHTSFDFESIENENYFDRFITTTNCRNLKNAVPYELGDMKCQAIRDNTLEVVLTTIPPENLNRVVASHFLYNSMRTCDVTKLLKWDIVVDIESKTPCIKFNVQDLMPPLPIDISKFPDVQHFQKIMDTVYLRMLHQIDPQLTIPDEDRIFMSQKNDGVWYLAPMPQKTTEVEQIKDLLLDVDDISRYVDDEKLIVNGAKFLNRLFYK